MSIRQYFKKNTKFQILTPSGWENFSGIFKNSFLQEGYELKTKKGYIIRATKNHILYQKSIEKAISDFKEGDTIDLQNNEEDTVVYNKPVLLNETMDIFKSESGKIIANCFISHQCDEFAFVKPNIASDFWASIQPTLAEGGSCIITSTPNSDEDQFANLWFDSQKTIDESGKERENGLGINGFKGIKITWEEHPDRNEEWRNEQISKIGISRFERENNCKFIQADELLISPLILANLKGKDPIYITSPFNIRWYKEPEKKYSYIVALDPSLGVGNDYAAIQVLEIPTLIQICEWRANNVNPKNQVLTLKTILEKINEVLITNNASKQEIYWSIENNTVGEAVLIVIEDTGEHSFPGYFVSEPRKLSIGFGKKRKGLLTTNKSKLLTIEKLKNLIETDKLKINSKLLISELKNYVRSGNGFQAKYNSTDDLISALLLCIKIMMITKSSDEKIFKIMNETIDDENNNKLDAFPILF